LPVPVQPVPDIAQFTPLFVVSFVTVAVNPCVPASCTLVVVSDKLTAIADGAAVTVIVAAADFVASDTDVAVSVTVAGFGTLAGAVYVIAVPEALDVVDKAPHVAPLHPLPDSAQVTPLFAESFATLAVNAWALATCTFAVVSDKLTAIAGGVVVTVIVVVAVLVVSASAVAVSVTVAGFGALAGAV
jgi:hypothetical protein